MERAILKTLIYADIFDFPLKINEIHKWLFGKKVTVRQVEKALGKLFQELRIKNKGEYFFLKKRDKLVAQRRRREKQSAVYFRKAKYLSQIFKIIPWIKLVGISGGLALNNASKKDDIDLFIITERNRLWISRLLALGLISLTGQRRAAGATGRRIAGKFCINLLLEEDKLEQTNKDIFVSHEVLQMKVLWQRDGIYSKFLADNEWVFKFLPNWVSVEAVHCGTKKRSHGRNLLACEDFAAGRYLKPSRYSAQNPQHFLIARKFAAFVADYMEDFAKKLQLKIMQKPQGMERIEDGALYFHPEDCRTKILSEYRRRIKI